MSITPNLFRTLFPACRDPAGYASALSACFSYREINTRQRMAAFLAQTGHETGGYTAFVENLNYSADGLMKTFRGFFPDLATAQRYARLPERIANRVYANRMGNGSEASGDGWRFRGRGAIQLTGRQNYKLFGRAMLFIASDGETILVDDLLKFIATPEGAVETGGWFWTTRNLNAFADRGDIEGMTRIINGGQNGIADRRVRYQRALSLLSAP